MSDPKDTEDKWPNDYNPGRSDHLHALGVIAITFARLQAGIDYLYVSTATRHNLPIELVKIYYFNLPEDKRPEAIRFILKHFETDQRIVDLISNLLDYYAWCLHCRNQLLHAEQFPPSLGGQRDTLYLTKRRSKTSTTSVYIKLTTEEIRQIADNIHRGAVQCAKISIYLRFRDDTADAPSEIEQYLLLLPEKLALPRSLELALRP